MVAFTPVRCSSFTRAMDQLKHERVILPDDAQKSVIILGAGPAGLIRAIQSVMEGHRTTIVEKRASDAQGRCNTLALKAKTIELLKEYGVYQFLLEEKKIYPPNTFGYTSVRLGDLEQALKRVLLELSAQNAVTFRYSAQVAKIDTDTLTGKAQLSLNTKQTLEPADVIVNTEGAHSTTNLLLNNPRIEVLPKVPVIAAIFEEDRPRITGVCSFFVYVEKSIEHIALSIYYYTIFFFRFVFMNERLTSNHRNIAGSLILRTPGQNYVGCGFSPKTSNELLELQKAVQQKRRALLKAEEKKDPTQDLKKELKKAEAAYGSFVKYWTYLSFCIANVYACFARIIVYLFKARTEIHFDNASLLPIKDFKITEIGADKALHTYKLVGKSIVLIAGDALATVDPATGLGCNTALQTSNLFKDVLHKLKQDELSLEEIGQNYDLQSQEIVSNNHRESRHVRKVYLPDAANKQHGIGILQSAH